MFQEAALAALSLGAGVYAQQIGTNTAEVHPKLSVSKCSSSGCTTEQHTVVLDANWRWLHTTTGYTNCYSGNTWDATLCPDPTTCAQNCALDGADYTGTYGITASGNSLSLQLVTGTNSGSRVYLMDTSDKNYQEFNLLNQEFTFDVDVSKLPCGLNGALYFSAMDADGGASKYPTNKAGAAYGTGYCDSQCPHDIKFIEGKANIEGWTPSSNSANTGKGDLGACCSEMDIWEANSISTAYTPHPCTPLGLSTCDSNATCASGAVCDQAGCDYNSYRMGNTTFYGPGSGFTLDTTKKMTVVTQFLTDDGTSSGNLVEIKRFYVQNGVTYANSQSDIAGVSGNSITQDFCDAAHTAFDEEPNTFNQAGSLVGMGNAFKQGMVLVLSIWDDYAVNMLWLDSDYPTTSDPTSPGVARGSCSTSSGNPKDVEANSPGSTVVFSNIKYGSIGSTFTPPKGPGGGSSSSSSSKPPTSSTTSSKPSSSTSSSKPPTTTTTSTKPTTTTTTTKPTTTTTTTKSTTTSASGGNCAAKYGQCGGTGWGGATCCASGSTCKYSNPYYSQCL